MCLHSMSSCDKRMRRRGQKHAPQIRFIVLAFNKSTPNGVASSSVTGKHEHHRLLASGIYTGIEAGE